MSLETRIQTAPTLLPNQNTKLGGISLEDAAELIEQMTDKEEIGNDGTRCVKGIHPDHGPIYVVIPPLGNSLLLPFAIQSDAL